MCAWAFLFSAIHWYWALGGRAGLGTTAAEADAALATFWFAAYNAGIAVVSLMVCVLVALGIRPRAGIRLRRVVTAAALAGAALLLLRGGLGLSLLVADVATGTWQAGPPLLVAIEFAFVAGGILFGTLGLTLRRAGRSLP